MASMAYGPHIFYGGHSLILINLDHSKVTGLTNTVCHSYDIRVTLSTTHVTIFCTTRRCDVLRISLFHVVDIRRRRASDAANNLAAVELDFTVPTGPAMHAVGGGSTKALRCVVQCELGDGPNDGLFHALLAQWSAHRNGAPRQANAPAQGGGVSSWGSASIFGSVDFTATADDNYRTVGSTGPFSAGAAAAGAAPGTSMFRSPGPTFGSSGGSVGTPYGPSEAYMAGSAGGSSTPRGYPHQQRGSCWSRSGPDVYTGQLPPDSSGWPSRVGSPSGRHHHDQQSYQQQAYPHHYHRPELPPQDVERDRMRQQLCSELELELQLIQQRRMQRQQLLLNLQRPVGENMPSATATAGGGGASSSPSGNVFRDAVVDPNSVAAGFASLCPHCGIFSSDEHTASCPHRVVQCLRCLSLMKMLDFSPHTSVCSKQYNGGLSPTGARGGGGQGLSPYSPVPPPITSPGMFQQQQQQEGSMSQQRALSEVPDLMLPPSIVAMTGGGGGGVASVPTSPSGILKKAGMQSAAAAQPSDPGTAAGSSSGSVKCPWCGKMTPPEHERKCAERRLRCVVCGDEIYLREKEDHRNVCKTPSRATASSGGGSSSASLSSSSRLKSAASRVVQGNSFKRGAGTSPSSPQRTVSFV